jgi:hypothetical protein
MSGLYSYFSGENAEEECHTVDKAFLENRYNTRIRDKFLNKFSKRYAKECIEQKRREKILTEQMARLFNKLKTAIQIKQEYISGQVSEIPKWAASFFTIDTLLNFMKSLPKQVEMPEFPTSELVINFMFYCGSFAVSWSQYFLMFKEGRDILKNVFFKQELESILAFSKAIIMVGVTKGYDDILFRKDLYSAFPDVEKYLITDPSVTGIYRTVALFVVGNITFTAFSAAVRQIAKRVQKVEAQ